MTFSNLKSHAGCQFDVRRLIDYLQLRESTTMSLTLKPLPGNLDFTWLLLSPLTEQWNIYPLIAGSTKNDQFNLLSLEPSNLMG